MTDDTVHQGGCLCGAVRYRATAEPLRASHCHCKMCRRHGGVLFQTWVSFPSDRFTFVRGAPTIYPSSDIAERGHCNRCGTPLTFQYLDKREYVSVSVGSLDRPDEVTPTVHFWAKDMIPWLSMDDRLPRRTRH